MKILHDFILILLFKELKDCFLAFNNTTVGNKDGPNKVKRNSHRKSFLPRVNIISYNVLTDGRNCYDQPINDQIKKYDEIRKIATGQGDDYTTGSLLHYHCFRDHYQLIAVDLSKQKELDANPRAIQQIGFYGILKANSQVFSFRKKQRSSFSVLQRNSKSLVSIHKWLHTIK